MDRAESLDELSVSAQAISSRFGLTGRRGKAFIRPDSPGIGPSVGVYALPPEAHLAVGSRPQVMPSRAFPAHPLLSVDAMRRICDLAHPTTDVCSAPTATKFRIAIERREGRIPEMTGRA
jgi:hypothetical protein